MGQAQLEEALAQGVRLDALMQRAQSMMDKRRDACDRILHVLQSDIVFQQGQNNAQSLIFNVPLGHDFEAVWLMALPEVRIISLDEATDGPSDLTYRATTWIGAGTACDPFCSIDALFDISVSGGGEKDPRAYNNAAFPAQQLFSSPVNVNQAMIAAPSLGAVYSQNQWPSGLVFEPYWPMKAGSSMLVQVTPLYSGLRSTELDGRVYEYRIRGLLAGEKKVQR